MAEKRTLSPNERADLARLKRETEARLAIDAEYQAMSDSELQSALADATRLAEEDGAMRQGSIICEVERRCEAGKVEQAKRAPALATSLASPPPQSVASEPESEPVPTPPPPRLTKAELKRQHDERMEHCLSAVAAEHPAGARAKPLTAEECLDIARGRHPRSPIVIHPTSVEPHPDLPPPLCVERERIRMEKEKSK